MPAAPDEVPAILAHAPLVEAAVRSDAATLATTLRTTDAALGDVADALVDAAEGGKRLRGALVCWSFVAHGGADVSDVVGAASALELVHLSALIHDDVIDRAATRRGRPSVPARFGERPGVNDPDHGRDLALLLGDVVLASAPASLEHCRVDEAALARARAALVALQIEVSAGQLLDLDVAARGDVDPQRALRVASLKSGRYSVGRPLELGALLAGVAPGEAVTLLAVGDPIGVAFQLRDDILGVFGDPAETGKPTGSDLAEGKRTLLVAETLERLDADGRARFEARFGSADPTAVAGLAGVIAGSDARTAVEERIAALQDEARRAILATGLDDRARDDLAGLATWAGERRR